MFCLSNFILAPFPILNGTKEYSSETLPSGLPNLILTMSSLWLLFSGQNSFDLSFSVNDKNNNKSSYLLVNMYYVPQTKLSDLYRLFCSHNPMR